MLPRPRARRIAEREDVVAGDVCAACGQQNAPGQRFCGGCGTLLARTCSSCGEANPPHFRFCGNCGNALSAGLEDQAQGPGEERRWATVLFADLSGFTHLSGEMDPEDVRTFVDRCMLRMGTVVEQFQGSVSRVIGDALMALFGAPAAHDDDAERAVRAALELQRYVRENPEEVRGLSLRVGVNTGEMMYAPVGPDRSFTVMGDPVNTAARLQTAAPPGGVLVGEETYRATRSAIRYEPAEQLWIKGKDAPIWAARAVEPLIAPGERTGSAAPMVGRAAELALLMSTWDRVVDQKLPRLVTVVGAPGIGKSRLSREFAAVVAEQGGRVLRGRSLPYGESTGYGAFGRQLGALAGIFETDSAPVAREKLGRSLASILPPDLVGEVASRLAVMVGLGTEAGAPDRGVLFFATRTFVEGLATERPAMLLFEDMHWADPSLLDLVEFLVGSVRDAPLLFLAVARPELLDRRPGWGSARPGSDRLDLEALSDRDAHELVRRLLPGIKQADVVDRLVETAGGNPLFVEELAASVIEQATQLAAAAVPTNVKAIIAARLDALPPSERRLLLEAAVVGTSFWKGALATGGEAANRLLDSLVARDLLRREPASRIERDEEFSFKHILIREVAYATLPRAERRRKHAAVALFIEERTGDRMGESASLLAHHWREAGDQGRALDYLLVAAEHAGRAWAKGEAVSLYTEALDLVPTDDRARRASILLERAMARAQAGDLRAAATEFDDVLPELEGRERFEALRGRADVAYWLVDLEGCSASSARAIELAETLGDAHLKARALGVASLSAAEDGHPGEAVAMGRAALADWTPGSHTRELGVLLGKMGAFHYWLGDYEPGVECARSGYQLGIDTQSVEGILVGGADLGLALTGMGRHEEALAVFDEVVARGREIELVPRFTARAMNMCAGTLRELLDVDAARTLNEEAVEIARRVAFPYAQMQGRIDLLLADLAGGHASAAEKAWPGLWQEAQTAKGLHRWLMAGRLAAARADVALALGRPEAAAEAARESLAHADRYGRRKYQAASLLTLGRALLELQRPAKAVVELKKAVALAQRLAHPPSIWQTSSWLARALTAIGDDDGAEEVGAAAGDEIARFARTLSEERRARFLGAAEVADLIGTRGNGR
jgi:class 3 adenylate cyclase/tetratricopeptide (TPR) repeat protein